MARNEKLEHNSMNGDACYLLTLTGKAGACKARPGSGKTSQGSRDSPPSPWLADTPWKEPQPKKTWVLCLLYQGLALRAWQSLCVSVHCCCSFTEINCLGKVVSKTPSNHDPQ